MSRGPVLFISDLHLSVERPRINRAFFGFLNREARAAHALYILGDLFDYWVGDDDLAHVLHARIAAELAQLAASGCELYFMHGNRDFLAGERFASAAHLALLIDPTVVDLAGQRTVLTHGDMLCTLDIAYQRFRAKVHTAAWQREFLAKPLAERRAIALQLRDDSRTEQREKTDAIMDVTPGEVEALFRTHGCTRIIHGHTHRPARHDHMIDGRRCERWVLADWYQRGSYLRCDETGHCAALTLAM